MKSDRLLQILRKNIWNGSITRRKCNTCCLRRISITEIPWTLFMILKLWNCLKTRMRRRLWIVSGSPSTMSPAPSLRHQVFITFCLITIIVGSIWKPIIDSIRLKTSGALELTHSSSRYGVTRRGLDTSRLRLPLSSTPFSCTGFCCDKSIRASSCYKTKLKLPSASSTMTTSSITH